MLTYIHELSIFTLWMFSENFTSMYSHDVMLPKYLRCKLSEYSRILCKCIQGLSRVVVLVVVVRRV